MAFSKTFEGELNKLFRKRTHWLRQKLGTAGVGKPPVFNRKTVKAGIERLQQIASDALSRKLARVAFDENVKSHKNRQIKGHGPAEKKANFEKWFIRIQENQRRSLCVLGEEWTVYLCRSHRITWKPTFLAFRKILVFPGQASHDF
jgi:hypothetical protein